MTSARVGRPREFDLEEALECAMRMFWEHGYDGLSLADLARGMGISKPSLYAAFGDKRELFKRALRRYEAGPASYVELALTRNTAYEVVDTLLHGAARATTSPDSPHGCLTVQGAIVSSDSDTSASDLLACWRAGLTARLTDRFTQAQAVGDLDAAASVGRLARYVSTVASGIAVEAATGVGRTELDEVADVTMRAWSAIAG
ncbi:TetR/AcrR family transcriptional regulator [Sphingomonas sp. LR61]|uniref:TetR/AcrR family transcriptional regulator n=1 Tax=Sphingomonas sp. LR61 TaxID=3050234 RepID=UPI002FE1D699